MNIIKYAFFITISTLACKHITENTQVDSVKFSKDLLTQELIQIHKQGFINGFSVAIVNENGILYKSGIGYSNVRTKEAYTEHTLQNIVTISKTLVGLSLLNAQEMDKLSLDDPVNNYLPFEVIKPNFPAEQITIRYLATHTSSILDTDLYFKKTYLLKNGEEKLKPEIVEIIGGDFNPEESKLSLVDFNYNLLHPDGAFYKAEGFSQFKPGTIFEYSNVGAVLAATVVEFATHQSFDEFTKEHILNPLKMSSSGWSLNDIELENHSTQYLEPGKKLPLYSYISYPYAGLITNINDLGMYLSELIKGYSMKGTLLQKESYQELFKEQLSVENFIERDTDDYSDEYNSGIFMGFSPLGHIGHSGLDPGTVTYMFFNPRSNIGRLLIVNTNFINNVDGKAQFDTIWNTLSNYENKFNQP